MGSDIKFCVPVLDTRLPIQAIAFVLCEFELRCDCECCIFYTLLHDRAGQDITCRHSLVWPDYDFAAWGE